MPSPRTSRSRPSIRGRRPRRTARSPATDSSSKARSNATEPTRSCRRKAPARARSSTRRPWPRRPRAAARPILEPALLRSKRSEASGNIMPDGPQTPASRGLRIVAITADADFEQSLRATFGRSAQIDLAVVAGAVGGTEEKLPLADATVLLVDLDATRSDELAALQTLARRLAGSVPILVVTAGFSESVARQLIQLRIADFLVKPVDPVELVRACGRVAKSSAADGATEAEIYTFLPAAGGVGVTTLAVETAMLLMRRTPRGGVSTCLVDLDFQHGACADYLDIEPRLDIGEIEPRPERLDGQLLEVMLSQHGSGLAVIAAPNRPAEMRSFDADVATPSNWSQRSASVSRAGRSRRSSSTGSSSSCSVPGCAARISSRRWAPRLAAPFPTITGWCAKRSIAASRSRKCGRETTSRRRSKNSCSPRPRPKPAPGRQPAGCGGAGECYGRAEVLLPSRRVRAVENLTRKRKMLGRFTSRRIPAPELLPAPEAAPVVAPVLAPVEPEPAAEPPGRGTLLSEKLLDAKVRLHRRLIEEIHPSALQKMPEEEGRRQIHPMVSPNTRAERLALNAQELEDFVTEILDEMMGLGPIEPLLKDPTVNDILINSHEQVYVERRGVLEPSLVRFKDEAHLLRIVNKIVSAVGRRVDESQPLCDARLLDGSRINIA